MKDIYIRHIASRLGLKPWQVENCVQMFEDGDTIPFISRYRKERTGGMDDMEVASVRHWADVFSEMEKRKGTILETIDGLGKLTPELRARIEGCIDAKTPGMIRASFGIYNTEAEVDEFLEMLQKAMEHVKNNLTDEDEDIPQEY